MISLVESSKYVRLCGPESDPGSETILWAM